MVTRGGADTRRDGISRKQKDTSDSRNRVGEWPHVTLIGGHQTACPVCDTQWTDRIERWREPRSSLSRLGEEWGVAELLGEAGAVLFDWGAGDVGTDVHQYVRLIVCAGVRGCLGMEADLIVT